MRQVTVNRKYYRAKQRWEFAICFAVALMALTPSLGMGAPGALGPMTVACGSIDSKILGRGVDYCVALPADYATSGTTRYPTLYFLHGLFEHDNSWVDKGGKAILDGLRAQRKVGDFIVILPDAGDTFYVNSFDGKVRYEDFFIQEFIPFIDHTYRTIPTREGRGISGVSMGGYGSLHLGMLHADLFGAASAHSAVLIPKLPNPIPADDRRMQFYARILESPFGNPLNESYWDANNPLDLAEHPGKFKDLKLYFDCGDQDRFGFEKGGEMLDQILTKQNFPHTWVLRPGGHGWDYLNQYLQYSILFHWKIFEEAEKQAGANSGGQP
jgi:S-formylglutathione hydrolase FrmB